MYMYATTSSSSAALKARGAQNSSRDDTASIGELFFSNFFFQI